MMARFRDEPPTLTAPPPTGTRQKEPRHGDGSGLPGAREASCRDASSLYFPRVRKMPTMPTAGPPAPQNASSQMPTGKVRKTRPSATSDTAKAQPRGTANKVLATSRGERGRVYSSSPRPSPGKSRVTENPSATTDSADAASALHMTHIAQSGVNALELLPDGWEERLATVRGQVFRGTERVASGVILSMLGIPPDRELRQKIGRRLVTPMRALGWQGPKTMRVGDTRDASKFNSSGYWRLPCRPPDALPLEPSEEVATEGDLSELLDTVTRLGLRKLARILRMPTNVKDGNLLRSQVTAAGIAINGQLRADEARLRAKVTGDVLARLLAAIEKERARQARARADEPAPSLDVLAIEAK